MCASGLSYPKFSVGSRFWLYLGFQIVMSSKRLSTDSSNGCLCLEIQTILMLVHFFSLDTVLLARKREWQSAHSWTFTGTHTLLSQNDTPVTWMETGFFLALLSCLEVAILSTKKTTTSYNVQHSTFNIPFFVREEAQ